MIRQIPVKSALADKCTDSIKEADAMENAHQMMTILQCRLEKEPIQSALRIALAEAYLSLGRLREAKTVLTPLSKHAHQTVRALSAALIALAERKPRVAFDRFRLAEVLDPSDPRTAAAIWRLSKGFTEKVEQIVMLRRALVVNPLFRDGLAALQFHFIQVSAWQVAEASGRKLLVISPGRAHDQTLFAWTLLQGGATEQACRKVRWAKVLAPRNGFTNATAAKIYFDNGKLQDCEVAAKNAIDVDFARAENLLLLARTLRAQQRVLEGNEMARRAIELKPALRDSWKIVGYSPLPSEFTCL